MKAVDITVEISPDGKILTYSVPGVVPKEMHQQLEDALKGLTEILGTVTSRTSLHPTHSKTVHEKNQQHLGHDHGDGHHHHH